MEKINRVYVHVPFCRAKCGYCDFHSYPAPNEELIDSYLLKLEQDVKREKTRTRSLDSVFIGGGTPGYLSLKNLEKLFSIVSTNFRFCESPEISIECNPESLTKDKIRIIADFATRISLGVQTFNEVHRKTLRRTGGIKKVYEAIETIKNSNIHNISCDIIYGIPGQSVTDLEKDICKILDSNVFCHFSAYALSFEENTQLNRLYSERKKNKIDTTSIRMWKLIPEIIKGAGFKRYEISNYALYGKECKHNVDIWFGGKYLGFGPSSSSFDGNIRWTEQKLPAWLRRKNASYDRISKEDRMNEIFIMGLRTLFGWKIIPKVESKEYEIRGPYENSVHLVAPLYINDLKEKLVLLETLGLLNISYFNGRFLRIVSTEKGLSFWNEIALHLL